MSAADATPPRRRRRRWPIVLLVLVVVLALLVVGAELVGRRIATDAARDRIASALGVSRSSDVTVDLGSRPILLQAAEGRLQVVTARSRAFQIDGLHGSLDATARNVTLAEPEAGAVRATVEIPDQSGFTALVRKQVDVDSVRLRSSRVVVAKSFRILGVPIGVSETLTVSASGGRLVLTPERLTVNGARIALSDVRRSPFASALADLTSAQSQCVDSSLPRGLHLESARLEGSTLHLLITGIEVHLDGTEKGTCS